MRTCVFAQPAQIITGLLIILLTTNQLLNTSIKGLDTDLELQGVIREPGQNLL